MSMRPPLYKFTGNTYPNRYTLRQLGAEWDPDKRAWYLRLGGNGGEQTIWSLRRDGVRCERLERDDREPEGPSADDIANDMEAVYG
jgi:hypothetical protein